jgi:hypothetical protein
MITDERLEKVEGQLTRLTWISGGLIVGVVLCLVALFISKVSGPKTGEEQIRAKSFVLEDDNGKVRAILAMVKDIGPTLELNDESGKSRAVLLVLKDIGPGLMLCDETGKVRVELKEGKDGTGLMLSDENSKTRAQLGTGQTKTPDGKVISYPESSLILYGADEKVIWSAP